MVFPYDEICRIRELCDARDLWLHLDGARLWNASVVTGMSMADHSKPFDSVSVCLSKGLGCPIGSVLVGPVELIAHARHLRKAFGGGWRQAGFLAAAGHYALDHHVERLAEDHSLARILAERLLSLGFSLVAPRHTNILLIHDPHLRLVALSAALAKIGVFIAPSSPSSCRFVTHLDLNLSHVDELTTFIQTHFPPPR